LHDAAGNLVYGDDPDWALARSAAANPNPPAVAARPAIVGDAVVGALLRVDEGIWNGDPPLTYAYQWQRCDTDAENCVEIAGATSGTYTVDRGDAGSRLRIDVTATNFAGTASSGSDATAIIPIPNDAPTIRTASASLSGGTLHTTLTTCDDAPGRLTASLETSRFSRTWSWSSRGGCHTTTHAWRTPKSGRTRFGTLRVRDAHGAWSKPVRLRLR
jgi:hypothetical protein